jgi:Reverse transcriptase (RNA-dependent DNA polymerase)/Endonuclease-reverse transcriptase
MEDWNNKMALRLFIIFIFIRLLLLCGKCMDDTDEVRAFNDSLHASFDITYINLSRTRCSVPAMCAVLRRADLSHRVPRGHKRNRTRFSGSTSERQSYTFYALLLLAMCGDIELNPGPLCLENISMYYMNARSISGPDKMKEFNMYFAEHSDVDVICLTETWLNNNIFESEILDHSQYAVYRRDRCPVDRQAVRIANGGGRAWGGVLIAISTKYASRHLEDTEECEIMWVEITISSARSIFVGCAYLPPKPSTDLLAKLQQSIWRVQSRVRPSDCIWLGGDFNFPDITWEPLTNCPEVLLPSVVGNTNSEAASEFLNMLHELDLYQLVPFPTRQAHFLDLVFTNNLDFPMVVKPSEPAVSSDHSALLCNISLRNGSDTQRSKIGGVRYNWNKVNMKLLNESLKKCQWSLMDDVDGVNAKCEKFYTLVNQTIAEVVPILKVNTHKYPPWFDRSVINSVNDKNRAYRCWKRTGQDSDRVKFQVKRTFFNKLKVDKHREYIQKVDADVSRNPKLLWGFIRRKTMSKRIPLEVEFQNVKAGSINTCCQLFSDYFESTFLPASVTSEELPEAFQYGDDSLSCISINKHEVELCLRNLNNNKSPGPDLIPMKVLKYCSEVLSAPLTDIFNCSLKEGTFPNRWKLSHVTPVLKKGSRFKVVNYRPISLLSVFSKIFESLLHKRISNHVSKWIAPEQHGFVRRKSTITNLAEFTSEIARNINNRVQVDAVYTDFSKAFDRVDHRLLLHKLSSFGISGQLHCLLSDYLNKRVQKVVIGSGTSSCADVTSGVPQGSVLGPLLFTMFVNDIPQSMKTSQCLMYADDLKIFRPIHDLTECSLLQEDLKNLENWCRVWKLTLNISKCNVITFTNKRKNVVSFEYMIGSDKLTRVCAIKDLGVIVSSDFSYSKHIDSIKPKAYRLLGLLRRNCLPEFKKATNRALYISLVRPQVEYASVIWNPHHITKVQGIERVQMRFIKLMGEQFDNIVYHRDNYLKLCSENLLTPLTTRRRNMDMVFLHKLVNGEIDSATVLQQLNFNVPQCATRSVQVFRPLNSRIDIFKYSCLQRLQRSYNILSSMSPKLDLNFNTLPELKAILNGIP